MFKYIIFIIILLAGYLRFNIGYGLDYFLFLPDEDVHILNVIYAIKNHSVIFSFTHDYYPPAFKILAYPFVVAYLGVGYLFNGGTQYITDLQNYMQIHSNAGSLLYLMRSLSFVFSVALLPLVYKILSKCRKDIVVAVLLFITFSFLHIQISLPGKPWSAMVFFYILSYYYYNKGKPGLSITTSLLAALFHQTGITALIFPIIWIFKHRDIRIFYNLITQSAIACSMYMFITPVAWVTVVGQLLYVADTGSTHNIGLLEKMLFIPKSFLFLYPMLVVSLLWTVMKKKFKNIELLIAALSHYLFVGVILGVHEPRHVLVPAILIAMYLAFNLKRLEIWVIVPVQVILGVMYVLSLNLTHTAEIAHNTALEEGGLLIGMYGVHHVANIDNSLARKACGATLSSSDEYVLANNIDNYISTLYADDDSIECLIESDPPLVISDKILPGSMIVDYELIKSITNTNNNIINNTYSLFDIIGNYDYIGPNLYLYERK